VGRYTVLLLAVTIALLTGAVGSPGPAAGQGTEAKAYGEGGGRALVPRAAAGGKLKTIYLFTGVTDDGEQGSANRKEATSVTCTNVDPKKDADIEVRVFQYNGTDMFTGTVTAPPGRTFTFSTQNTTIYFDDAILKAPESTDPGTDAIFQGFGRVLASHKNVVCTAQALDPLNYPPVFAVGLDMLRTASAPKK
jgi:hypothetical protein